MQQNQSVSEMATEVLARQAGSPRQTDRRIGGSSPKSRSPNRSWTAPRAAARWGPSRREGRAVAAEPTAGAGRGAQASPTREERRRLKEEERSRARKAAWESFMRRERRELELRKDGQLAELLGEALAGSHRRPCGGWPEKTKDRPKRGWWRSRAMAKRTTSSWRSSQKGIWRPGSLLIGCGRRGSRSGGTGGSITGEAPEGKAACSEVYSAAFSSPRRTIAQCTITFCGR